MGYNVEPIDCPKCNKRASKTINNNTLEFVELLCAHCGYRTEESVKFQLCEASSGGEVGTIVEANTKGEAAIKVLEGMGYILVFDE